MKILVSGNEISGVDSKNWIDAFKHLGHIVSVASSRLFIPAANSVVLRKAIKLITPYTFAKEYNKEILALDAQFNPDIFFVFKGDAIEARTLKILKQRGRKLFMFFPDTSFYGHGKNIPECIKLYDHIFSSKSFHIDELKEEFNYDAVSYMPHCANPDVHRKLIISEDIERQYNCEASFIGGWTPKKENYLAKLYKMLPDMDLKIWGPYWDRISAKNNNLKKVIQGYSVWGDLYSAAINCSKINIALLVERQPGGREGDRITSRTFHIPSAGGFMLHERTEEFLNCYIEGTDADCFSTPEELAQKIEYYLANPDERERIAENGYQKTHKEHLHINRAEKCLEIIKRYL